MVKYTKGTRFVSAKDLMNGKGYDLPPGSRVLEVNPAYHRQGYDVTYEFPLKNPCAEIPAARTATEVRLLQEEAKYKQSQACMKKALDMVDKITLSGYTYEELLNMNYEQLQETFDMTKKTDLYELTIDDKKVYGEYLTRDSKGNMVFELKGSGEVVSVPATHAEKVMPYTVSIKFHQGTGGWSPQKYDYFLEKDQEKLSKDDMIFVLNSPNGISLAKVVGTDTKSAAATKQLSCFKLEGELLNQ